MVSLKAANPAWLRSAGEAFESELTKGDAPHRLQDGDTLYLVACDDDHAVRVELREPAAAGAPPQDGLVATPQQHTDALVPMSAGLSSVGTRFNSASPRANISDSKPILHRWCFRRCRNPLLKPARIAPSAVVLSVYP